MRMRGPMVELQKHTSWGHMLRNIHHHSLHTDDLVGFLLCQVASLH